MQGYEGFRAGGCRGSTKLPSSARLVMLHMHVPVLPHKITYVRLDMCNSASLLYKARWLQPTVARLFTACPQTWLMLGNRAFPGGHARITSHQLTPDGGVRARAAEWRAAH